MATGMGTCRGILVTTGKKSWPDFVKRAEKQFERADLAGINHSLAIYDAIINVTEKDGKMTVEMEYGNAWSRYFLYY